MLLRSLLLIVTSVAFGFCSGPRIDWDAISARTSDGRAQLHGLGAEDRIPDEYVVMFRPDHMHDAHDQAIGKNASDFPSFKKFSFGYQASLSDEDLNQLVRKDPGVRWVEANQHVHLHEPVEKSASEPNTTNTSTNQLSKRKYALFQELNAPYGLQMLAAGSKISPLPVKDNRVYDFVGGAGLGVNVYVLDTGIYTEHKFFQGRARNFKGLSSNDGSPYVDESMADIHGHGTHVAGTIGAKQYGVAPFANLINVKVLGKGAKSGNIAQAILDVAAEHRANKALPVGDEPWRFRGSIINMSLRSGNGVYSFLYQVEKANNAGVAVFAAAGNANKDASNTFPCAVPDVECIAAVDANYKKASFSNYGSSVDYIAPGEDIMSLGIGWNEDTRKLSGTSMACPHAVGAAAIFMSWLGLINNQAASYVYSNSVSYSGMGFPGGTTDLFINTGIHSPRKYPAEPFRWARDDPAKNHDIDLAEATTADLGAITTYTAATSVFSNPTISVPSGSAPLVEVSAPVGSATTYPTTLRSVTFPSFSFDPTASASAVATAQA